MVISRKSANKNQTSDLLYLSWRQEKPNIEMMAFDEYEKLNEPNNIALGGVQI